MNIFKMEVKKGFKSLSIWTIVCIALTILFMSMFPSMKNSGMQELVNTKMGALPPAMLEAFNLKDIPDFTKLNEYFAYIFQYIAIAGCIYAGMLGAKALIKEESEGTIEFLYAQPVSRTKILTMKLLSSVVLFYLFVALTAAASIVIALMVKPADLNTIDMIMDFKLLFGGFFLVGLVFMSIGFLISTLIKSLKLAMPLSTGLFFVTYILGILAGTIDKLKFLKHFSPFHYAVPFELIKNGFKTTNLVISIVIILCTVSTTYLLYRKKDFII